MFAVASLLCLTLSGSSPSTNPPIKSLDELGKHASAARGRLDSLSFVVDVRKTVETSVGRISENAQAGTIRVWMAKGERFRVEIFNNDKQTELIVSDGRTIAEWIAEESLWTQYPVCDGRHPSGYRQLLARGSHLTFAGNSVITQYAKSWMDPDHLHDLDISVAGMASLSKKKEGHDFKISLEPEEKVQGRQCYVVSYEHRAMKSADLILINVKKAIDKTTLLPVWKSQTLKYHKFVFLLLAKVRLVESYRDMRPDAVMPKNIFSFVPPEDSTFISPDDQRFAEKGIPSGQPAPQLDLMELNGQSVSLAEMKGKNVVLLAFWATWCGPCIQEIPFLRRLHKEYAQRGLKIVAISTDDDVTKLKSFVDGHRLPYTIVHDVKQRASELYRIGGIPHTVLIDRKGIVIKTWHGWSGEEEATEIRTEVAKLLK